MSKSASYNCWDEWDEVDYGDRWEEYDDYIEYNEWDEYDDSYGECYTAGVYSECTTQDTYDDYDDYSEYNEWDEHDDYGECYTAGVYADCGAQDQDYGEVDCPPGDSTYKDNTVNPGEGGDPGGSKQYKVLDILTSQYQIDGYIFDYIMHDTKKNTMIASTRNEEHFVSVEIAGSYDIDDDGDYCVSSYSAVTSEEVIRVNDFLKTIFLTAADSDIYYDENHGGTMIFSGIVGVYIQPGQIICQSTAYVKNPDSTYIIEFFKVRDVISEQIGGIADLQYESDSEQTIAKSNDDTVYRVDVYNAEFYLDERYVRYKSSVVCEELMLAKQAIVEQFGVPYVDIVCDNNRITYMDNGGISYEILWDDIGGYYYYDYDYYIPANAELTSTVYIPTQPAVPSNYYRVIRQIQQMTGLPESVITQDEDGLTYVYGVAVYVPQAIKFGGQVYATWDAVVSALRSAFIDIQSYIHSKGFYHGADDSGVSYDSIVYDSGYKKMLLLRVGLNIEKRIRIVDGTDYYDLALDESYIEDAVKDAFGVSAEELGAHAIEDRILQTYFYNDLHITKQRVLKYSSESFYVHGKKYNIGSYSTTYNGHKYLDKEKLLSLVKLLIPTLQLVSIKPEQESDENYTLFADKSATIKLSGTNLDHTAIQVTEPNGESTWYEQYFASSLSTAVSAKISFKDAGTYIIKCRGRNTIEPERVGETITYSRTSEKTITVTVYPALAGGLVYLKPYAEYTGCTVSENSSYTTVRYQHDHYGDPETVNYYKQIASPGAYQRKCAYDSYGMYLKRDDFRMDMDFDIVTDNNKNRDWYLEKRIWRLWRNGKVASFSNTMTDSDGKQYVDVNQNGNTRKIYIEPTNNSFYTNTSDRESIRLVNNHLVMPEDVMFNLFGVGVREYITNNYIMNAPDTNIAGAGSNITIFGLPLNVTCVFANDEKNYTDEKNITTAMNTYFSNNLVNVFNAIPEAYRDSFNYQYSANGIGKVYLGDKLLNIPSMITKSIKSINPNSYTDKNDYAKDALYAKMSDIENALEAEEPETKQIVIYGAGFGGFCAAYQAAKYRNDLKASGEYDGDINIVLINPVPVPKLGGIGTVGGQNYWDYGFQKINDKNYDIHGGTFTDVLATRERGVHHFYDRYNNLAMSEKMHDSLEDVNVDFESYIQHDIVDIEKDGDNIKSVTVRKIQRNNGVVEYVGQETTIYGDVFIDASEDGKLTMLSAPYTVGRYDYPQSLLDIDKKDNVILHPGCTLMILLKATSVSGIDGNIENLEARDDIKDCGNQEFTGRRDEKCIYEFNERHKNSGFLIKPTNSAKNIDQVINANGRTYKTWWLNSLLFFNVDGTLHERDIQSGLRERSSLYMTTDEAWQKAREFIKDNEEEMLSVYRSLGYENAEFVRYSEVPEMNDGSHASDDIVCGDILYIRETIHSVIDENSIGVGTENTNYAITPNDALYAGGINSGNDMPDSRYRNTSIALAKYNPDIHPYVFDNIIDDEGYYCWWMDSFAKIRNWDYVGDLSKTPQHESDDAIKERMANNQVCAQDPINTIYMPYSVLINAKAHNLLIPGYAACIPSAAWGEIRVFPNLCSLGDAAGVAAIYHAINSGNDCYNVTDSKIRDIQDRLLDIGAIIYKEDITPVPNN